VGIDGTNNIAPPKSGAKSKMSHIRITDDASADSRQLPTMTTCNHQQQRTCRLQLVTVPNTVLSGKPITQVCHTAYRV